MIVMKAMASSSFAMIWELFGRGSHEISDPTL